MAFPELARINEYFPGVFRSFEPSTTCFGLPKTAVPPILLVHVDATLEGLNPRDRGRKLTARRGRSRVAMADGS